MQWVMQWVMWDVQCRLLRFASLGSQLRAASAAALADTMTSTSSVVARRIEEFGSNLIRNKTIKFKPKKCVVPFNPQIHCTSSPDAKQVEETLRRYWTKPKSDAIALQPHLSAKKAGFEMHAPGRRHWCKHHSCGIERLQRPNRLSQEYEIQDEKTWTASALKEKSLPNVYCD